jgi:DNA-binding response OmpR family regulator
MDKNLKALVVDDEEVLRQMVGRVLKSMSLETGFAEDGLVALEKLKDGGYSVVLADIRMPNMDGIQLLKQVKKEFKNIDVIIMTAHTSQYSFLDVVESGASDYITKPFSVEELKAKIERVLRERQTMAELLDKTEKLETAYTEILLLKDDEEKISREINYERQFLKDEIGKLKGDNLRLNERVHGLEGGGAK